MPQPGEPAPRSRSEYARAFSDIVQANYYPDEIGALTKWAREVEKQTTIGDVERAHQRPYDWGNVDWEG